MSKWEVWMECDNSEYLYGSYTDRKHANEIALWLRDSRDVGTYVVESHTEKK
jgi:hypothetical protein